MKRFLALLLPTALLLTLCACSLPAVNRGNAAEPTPEAVEATPTPAPTPTPTPTPDPPPALDITGFPFLLANSYNSIGWEYQPEYASFEGQGVDQRIFEPLQSFLNAAREAGFSVWCSVIYRNPEYLSNRYLSYVWNVNSDPVAASEHVLAQGLDEHQTGLCADFTDQPCYSASYTEFDDEYMKDTDLYRWLVEHCTDYGFILRYPEGKEAFYGLACRHPAHFRYVGIEAAKYITEHDLCLEEFLLLYENNTVYLPVP